MTNYVMPSHTGIRSVVFRMASQNAITASPFTFKQQVLQHPGRRWEVDITLPPMRNASARIWIAWLAQLDGSLNTFTMGDPRAPTPQGSAGGAPKVKGANQTGASLNIDGCTASQTGWLKAGDYIQIGTGADARLHMITSDVNSDSSGDATLPLWPKITTAPANDASVVVSNAVGAFRLASNVSTWSSDELALYGISFSGLAVI